MIRFFLLLLAGIQSAAAYADNQPLLVWPDLAPGETSRSIGEKLPDRPQDKPTITRVEKVRLPTMVRYPAEQPNGTAILILPGGGFAKVVPNLEGSEAAPWLNSLGITVFVLNYRTNEVTPKDEPAWKRPLQDAQRALRVIRNRADEWKIDVDRVGVLGFSAGGQVASILHTAEGKPAYSAIDDVDNLDCAPNFSLLVYPWRILKNDTDLLDEIKPGNTSPPAFIVHTHDDRSTSVGAVMIYAGLRRAGVPAELHVYETGGHGYGTRPRPNSEIGTWPDRATPWLRLHKLANPAARPITPKL